jgi:glycosyltransferase involved in cell wall biosynthesis
MDKRYRFLVWGRGSEARSMREFGARLNQPGMLTIAERRLGRTVEFEELLSAADLALVTAHGGAPLLPAAACALAGVPIVAVDSPMIREALPGAGVLIVPPEGARPLARCLLELRENPDARRTLGATARANAQLRFDPRRFVREYAALYQRVAERHQIPTDPRHIAPAMS